ncbi:hypothetical protein ACIBW9_17200 [Streptomyces sp. NPDC049541]|uniref:hypothetical protein n=1 Tax=Streptomyces sp. NPDC049541 TaxID=3365594 RepID=UPI0037988C27
MRDFVIAAADRYHLLAAFVDPVQEEPLAGVAVCAHLDPGDLPKVESFGRHGAAQVEPVGLDGGRMRLLERFPVRVASMQPPPGTA